MKKVLNLWIVFSCLGYAAASYAQEAKPAMTFDELVSWNRIDKKAISDNGRWITCTIEPWIGNPAVKLYDRKGNETASFAPAADSRFTPGGNYWLVTEKPAKETLDSLKLKKAKTEEMPKNKLVIYETATGNTLRIDSLRDYKVAAEGDWLAYRRDTPDSLLYLRKGNSDKTVSFANVAAYRFPEKGNRLIYAAAGKNEGGVYSFEPETGEKHVLYEGQGVTKQTGIDKTGDKVAFIVSIRPDSASAPVLSLWLSENRQPAVKIAEDNASAFPPGWIVNEYTEPVFSENGARLFFATSPRPLAKDSTLLDEYFPKVYIWHWQEEKQYPQQLVEKEKDLRKGYKAVYNLNSQVVTQLGTCELPDITLVSEGNSPFVLASSSRPYALRSMWEGRNRYDVYRVDTGTGARELVKKGMNAQMEVSPAGKFGYWYNPHDSAWYAYAFDSKKEIKLTSPAVFKAYDEDNDVPDYPEPYGIAGWTEGDRYLLAYDKHDIWRLDPYGTEAPVNLTVNGRSGNCTYRLVQLDKEVKFVDTKAPQLLMMFDHTDKGSGYFTANLASASAPEKLLAGSFMLKAPLKAKNTNDVIYTAETFEHFPDLLVSDLQFRKSVRLTDANPQQQAVNWGTAELIRWTSSDGTPLEGVVYKPADFDPEKQYPLIVNFYERNADTYHSYRQPEPHRSTIDYHFYTSNGYVIFNPDVRYKDGYPGQSAYNCVVPGVEKLLARGYIDRKRIGAQGHSWGGYQVADLATRTDLFAAIESGAPVVNMFSAYGGMRWGTGLNRSFQYEHGQSRIGRTPWEAPELYRENSPLFNMDKVTTPILIMANDNDGHVPWYQGIEYFVALKRLQKPVWLLDYTGEPHWPMRLANRIDFQKRMFQFFQHYLNGKPMPEWMKKGVPAIRQEYTLGYE
ncbi:MAG: prolyl oligopeptidase family serine peptidase [Parabacteroides sp.]|nr:prolyl oligopeptidase family serine peptidase [Parabacteroides sp.]